MATDERAVLQAKLEQILGPQPAGTLMSSLPPGKWDELVNRDDLSASEGRLGLRFDAIDQRLDTVDRRLDAIDQRLDTVDRRLDELEQRLTQRIDLSEHRMLAAFRGELVTAVSAQTRMTVLSLMGSVLSTGGLVLAAARFA